MVQGAECLQTLPAFDGELLCGRCQVPVKSGDVMGKEKVDVGFQKQ